LDLNGDGFTGTPRFITKVPNLVSFDTSFQHSVYCTSNGEVFGFGKTLVNKKYSTFQSKTTWVISMIVWLLNLL
jgi:alpha-tubulin suppressor-like RCC1 family protein